MAQLVRGSGRQRERVLPFICGHTVVPMLDMGALLPAGEEYVYLSRMFKTTLQIPELGKGIWMSGECLSPLSSSAGWPEPLGFLHVYF